MKASLPGTLNKDTLLLKKYIQWKKTRPTFVKGF